jgi:thioredoxin 1
MNILAKLENEWQELLNYEGIILLNCWAHWCSDSQDIIPLIDQLAENYKDCIKVIKINIDESPKIAHSLGILGINSIPITFIFKCGNLVGEVTGMAPYEAFCRAVNTHLHAENSVVH